MPSGSPITQILEKLRGIAQILVNPQIWVIPGSDHPELRGKSRLDHPELGAPPIFEGSVGNSVKKL